MLLSNLLGERYKEKPADATIPSHIFLIKGGYIRHVANGIFSLLMPAKRIVNKIENIIREEMDAINGQEVLFPVVLPRELWDESGRYESVGSELVRFHDRSGGDYVLGMTHEEAAVHLARSEAKSYAQYPFMIYQIQTKFRDEPRSRGGLIRVREFTMKDAYSFHTTQEDLESYYEICHKAYERIFARTGLPQVVSVGSDTGMMGGSIAHEFMLLCDAGEDTIVTCPSCGYRANMEVAKGKFIKPSFEEAEMQKVSTPSVKEISALEEFLNKPAEQMIKAAVFAVEGRKKPVCVFIRGDLEVNEAKLRRELGANVFPLNSDQETDLCMGFIGPCGLKTNARVFYDISLKGQNDMVCGANEPDFHFTGVSAGRDFIPEDYVDVAKVNESCECLECGGKLSLSRGVEVGNIFQLGTKYTESMGMTYTDQDGSVKTPIMGCYGIGVGRLLACVAEASHDDYGPIWPYAVAPWQVHICALSNKKMDVLPVAKELYDTLSKKFEVLLDDRGVSAGVQFADADLLGVPIRLIFSVKNVENGEVEIATRDKAVRRTVKISEAASAVEEIAKEMGKFPFDIGTDS